MGRAIALKITTKNLTENLYLLFTLVYSLKHISIIPNYRN